MSLEPRKTVLDLIRAGHSGRLTRTEILAAVALLQRPHVSCEDPWYSCPALETKWGWTSSPKGGEFLAELPDPHPCNCGADEHNALLCAILEALAYESKGPFL